MPIDYSIQQVVDLYLELIDKLLNLASNHDSNSDESTRLNQEIDYYLMKIRMEMNDAVEKIKEVE